MENALKSTSSNRYVIEDSIDEECTCLGSSPENLMLPKVTSDGEPHELMTIVAMISGLIAAVIVLFVLFSLIGSRRRSNSAPETEEHDSMSIKNNVKTSTIIPMFIREKSIENDDGPRLVSIATISEVVPLSEGIVNASFKFSQPKNEQELQVSNLPGIRTVCC